MPQFKTTKELMAFVQKAIDKSLTEDVYPVIVDEEIEAIDRVVYTYKAKGSYKRRMDKGGMGDPKNIVIKGGVAVGGTLIVENITPANPYINGFNMSDGLSDTDKDLPSVIESGYGYDYWMSATPRRFTQRTINALLASGACTIALKKGLIKQGISVI